VGILNQHGRRRAEQGERFAGNFVVNHRRTSVLAQSARAGRESIRSFLDDRKRDLLAPSSILTHRNVR
jgi:hypothetical protein